MARFPASGAWLLDVVRLKKRLEARFAPADWSGLSVRASWLPSTDGSMMDLEIQATASSVGELRSLEIFVASDWQAARAVDQRTILEVLARDPLAAMLTYDGRESPVDMRRITTLPISATPDRPWPPVVTGLKSGSLRYVELAHSQDLARRVVEWTNPSTLEDSTPIRVRYGFFGHDLEKGVVIRGRLRGLWLPEADLSSKLPLVQERFLGEPPPLGP
jgi:hypothetical protein